MQQFYFIYVTMTPNQALGINKEYDAMNKETATKPVENDQMKTHRYSMQDMQHNEMKTSA